MRFFSGYFDLGLAGYDLWAHSTSSPVLGETIRSLHGLHSDRFFVAGYPENACAMHPKDNTLPTKRNGLELVGKDRKPVFVPRQVALLCLSDSFFVRGKTAENLFDRFMVRPLASHPEWHQKRVSPGKCKDITVGIGNGAASLDDMH